MADPLRRTLFAKLRGKKSKKTASSVSRGHEGKAKLLQQQRRRRRQQQFQAGPGAFGLGGPAGGSRGSPVPGRGEDEMRSVCEDLAGPPPLDPILADHDGGGDYYDNRRRRACGARRPCLGGQAASPCRRERERLRSRLQEAYYLLIHGMPTDTPTNAGYLRGTPSLATASSGQLDLPRRQLSASLPSSRSHLSSQSPTAPRSPLQRSVSDGVIDYLSILTDRSVANPPGWGQTSPQAGGSHPDHLSSSVCVKPSESNVMPLYAGSKLNKLGGPSDAVCGSCDQQNDRQGTSLKPPAVTVNKMQEWMHRGRMLSLEMKERISGSVKASLPSGSLPGQAARKVEAQKASSPVAVRVQGNKTASPPATQRVFLTDFIENVHTSSKIRRELKTSEANKINEYKPHMNNITVSKKRNWLQQSSLNPYLNEETNSPVSLELTNHITGPSPSSENKQQPAILPQETDQQNNHVIATEIILDHGEENDADDEGEIWYNPIPEDEDVDIPQTQSLPGSCPAKTENSDGVQIKSPKLPVSDLVKGQVTLGIPVNCSESVKEIQVASTTDVNWANCVNSTISTNSTECGQLRRQMCVCKSNSGTNMDESCVHKLPSAVHTMDLFNGSVCAVEVLAATTTNEFSPPSSPSPFKKGTAINWSFPEKIKSPRTVRKLSMKMRKLPEISRKLSIKGTSSHNYSDSVSKGTYGSLSPGILTNAASRNVISRYHLDTSVVSQNCKKKNSGSSKSASKGGYLSDGDSPELVAKSGKHSCESKPAKGNVASTPHKTHSAEIDVDAFRHYSFVDQPKCSQYISGLMSVHFYGAEDLKPPRIDSREVFCAIQVDSVNKARTALLTCRTTFLDMDHTFNIELENAQHLKLVVFSWEPTPRRNRVCCHGTVVLPTLFRVSKMHQLAVKLEPRGLIYVKLTLMEQWENSLDSLDAEREPMVFGVEARKIVEKENTGLRVPLLMQKCIVEIEKRGCQVVGLYRLCGSAAVKKELREAFERDSKSVGLSENLYPDINVITGVLKDYLRELPSPLITKQLYDAVLVAMAKQPLKITSSGCENDLSDCEYTASLLDCLPEVERATLKMLLDHLKLVASYHEVNKMTCQNLAVCFGPVLLSQRQEASNHSNRVFTDSEELASALDFKKHIEVLHYLLQLWPVQNAGTKEYGEGGGFPELDKPVSCVRRRKQRPTMLNLMNTEMPSVLRSRQVRLDSPSNRYAGDWSSCGESYLLRPKEESAEADYDDVPSEDTGSEEENLMTDGTNRVLQPHAEPESKEQVHKTYVSMEEISPALKDRVNLKDLQESIDTLIGNLERELSKNKLNVTC
ncbi:rho GTPase-activating protein SYDE2 [Hypanus sabinus]|uniref:rho GTPase-activating protein SYDE2 n=1 Tax=Hypanus sabinus TaxID=79690 RepID=UPI0028C46C25|nr:rho GTPase-activating protein SYDE2 [Hypanus sabinus]